MDMTDIATYNHPPTLAEQQRAQAIDARRAEVLVTKSENQLDRASQWISYKIHPLDSHKIITSGQQEILTHLLQAAKEASESDPVAAWNIFCKEAEMYLAQSTQPKAAINEWLATEASDEARLNSKNIQTPEKQKRTPKPAAQPTEPRSWKNGIASRIGGNRGAARTKEYYGGVLKGLNGSGTTETQALYSQWQKLVSQLDHVSQLVPVFTAMGQPYSKSAIIGSYNRLIDKSHPTVSGMFDRIAEQPDLFFSAIEGEIKRPLSFQRTDLLDAIAPAKQSIEDLKAQKPKGTGRG